MEQKAAICRLLNALRESVKYSQKLKKHMSKFDVDMDLFKDNPLEDAVCDVVFSVIEDTKLVVWWIFDKKLSSSYIDDESLELFTINTAEELYDYYFKRKNAKAGCNEN